MAPLAQLFSALKASKSHALEGSQNERMLWLAYQNVPAPSFDRSFARLQSSIAAKEERLRQLWRQTKARAKQELRQLVAGTPLEQTPAAQQVSDAAKVELPPPTQEQLAAMLGTNGWLRSTLLSAIGNASHLFMHHANSVNVVGADIMRDALTRPAGQALITVCNHVAALDDPLVVASIVPPEMYDQPSALRWTLCATDRCFKYASLAPFFTAAKVLPVHRGGGLQQPGMVAAESRLAQGDWVHIFPEGTRSRDPSSMGPIRKGVGRLVAAAAAAAPEGTPAPLLIPFVHAGMENIIPVGSKIPKIGNQVHVIVGAPIPLDDLVEAARQNPNDEHLYAAISSRVEQHMQRLHKQVHRLAAADAEVVQVESAGKMAVVGRLDAAKPAAVATPDKLWTSFLPASGSRGLLWGPDQQKQWEHMAFGMWHRVWASRIAVLQAVDAVGVQRVAMA